MNDFLTSCKEAAWLLLAALSFGMLASCSDDDNVIPKEEVDETLEVFIPTTDQLDVVSQRTTFVLNLENNGFNESLLNRLTNRVGSLSEIPEVVLIGNQNISTLTDADFSLLADIYLNDGAIVVTRPTLIDWYVLQFSIAEQMTDKVDFSKGENYGTDLISELMKLLENDPSDLEEDIETRARTKALNRLRTTMQDDEDIDWEKFMNDPFAEVIAIRNKETKIVDLLDQEIAPNMLVSEKTTVDENGNETVTQETLNPEDLKITYDGYIYGLFADEVAEWLNEDPAAQKTKGKFLAKQLANKTKADGEFDAVVKVKSELDANLNSRTIKGTYTYNAYGWSATRVVPINVEVNYATVHNFDTGYDYYLIEQKITSQNGKYLCPSGTELWSREHYLNRILGPYMRSLEVFNKFYYNDGKETATGISLPAENLSPRNTNGTTNYSHGVSFSLTGNMGVGSEGLEGGIEGGITINNEESYSTDDLTCYWNNDNTTADNSTQWRYLGNRPKGHYNIMGDTHDEVKPLLRADCFVQQNFVVRVTNPKDENITMFTKIIRNAEIYEGCRTFLYVKDSYNTKPDLSESFTERLPRPLRTQEEWTMSFSTPEGVTIANVEKFLKEFYPEHCKTTLSFMSPYTEKEKVEQGAKQYDLARLYVKSFMDDLEESADNFQSQKGQEMGVKAGEYVFTFTRRKGVKDQMQFKLTVPETGDATITDKVGVE